MVHFQKKALDGRSPEKKVFVVRDEAVSDEAAYFSKILWASASPAYC